MSFINALEPKFGRFAIPGLLKIWAALQLVCFILAKFFPDYIEVLILSPDRVMRGEVWRLVSFLFIPQTSSYIWIVFAVMLQFWMSDIMERAWGVFRLNCYVFLGAFLLVVASMAGWWFSPLREAFPGLERLVAGLGSGTGMESTLLYMSVFMALATIDPDYEIRIYGIIPVKMKYLGLINAGYLIYWFVDQAALRWQVVAVLIPFCLFCLPGFIAYLRHRGKVVVRRQKFESAKSDPGEAFHTCHACGKTDATDPQAEFRVAADGEEYCSACQPQ